MKIYTLNNSIYKVEFKDLFFSIDVDLRHCLGYINRNTPSNNRLEKKFKTRTKALEFMLKKSLIIKELIDENELNEVEIIKSDYNDYCKIFDENSKIEYYFNFNDGRKLFDKYLNFIVTTKYEKFTNGEISAKQLIEAFMVEEETK